MKQKIAIVVVVSLAVLGAGTYLLIGPANNTPAQNKDIESQAYQTKDPQKCDAIKGSSYQFGPTDAEIPISESAAQQLCREKIEKGIAPVLHGG